MESTASQVAQKVAASTEYALDMLAEYIKIPAISCEAAHAADVLRLAEKIRADLTKTGFHNARLLELDGALPCVAAEWLEAGPAAPTLLIYGHFDLQPVAGEAWNTPPHELVRKDGRVYARGSADDMGGWVSHLVALEAWFKLTGKLPCNVRLLLEGEEEIGSPNLEAYMDKFPDAFRADVMILTDCENPSTTIPGLTVSLRGLLEFELRCEAAECDVHSGLWGNLVPDSSVLLMQLVARLVDDAGRLKFGRRPVDAQWMASTRDLPMNDKTIAEGAHLLAGVAPLGEDGFAPAAWAWRQPALTILSTTLPAPGREKNAIRRSASATLSVRIAPGQTREELLPLLTAELQRDLPTGVRVSVHPAPASSESWDYHPTGPAFEAADRAYVRAWGRPLVRVGIGGSIPFVALFGRRFSKLPLILNGVIDPATTAHGPNESMHIGIFEKAMLANVYLYEELANLGAQLIHSK